MAMNSNYFLKEGYYLIDWNIQTISSFVFNGQILCNIRPNFLAGKEKYFVDAFSIETFQFHKFYYGIELLLDLNKKKITKEEAYEIMYKIKCLKELVI